jgi:hypothetical protein
LGKIHRLGQEFVGPTLHRSGDRIKALTIGERSRAAGSPPR